MNTIGAIVDQAFRYGYITTKMEAEISQLADNPQTLDVVDSLALDRLLAALSNGEIQKIPRKIFINIMEELVLKQAVSHLGAMETKGTPLSVDLGDIVAYALNRLPPLYATTQEGAQFQRQHAHNELQLLITQQIDEAISKSLKRPSPFPRRQVLFKQDPIEQGSIKQENIPEQVTSLLKVCSAGSAVR